MEIARDIVQEKASRSPCARSSAGVEFALCLHMHMRAQQEPCGQDAVGTTRFGAWRQDDAWNFRLWAPSAHHIECVVAGGRRGRSCAGPTAPSSDAGPTSEPAIDTGSAWTGADRFPIQHRASSRAASTGRPRWSTLKGTPGAIITGRLRGSRTPSFMSCMSGPSPPKERSPRQRVDWECSRGSASRSSS
jgi:hypothetical protein